MPTTEERAPAKELLGLVSQAAKDAKDDPQKKAKLDGLLSIIKTELNDNKEVAGPNAAADLIRKKAETKEGRTRIGVALDKAR